MRRLWGSIPAPLNVCSWKTNACYLLRCVLSVVPVCSGPVFCLNCQWLWGKPSAPWSGGENFSSVPLTELNSGPSLYQLELSRVDISVDVRITTYPECNAAVLLEWFPSDEQSSKITLILRLFHVIFSHMSTDAADLLYATHYKVHTRVLEVINTSGREN